MRHYYIALAVSALMLLVGVMNKVDEIVALFLMVLVVLVFNYPNFGTNKYQKYEQD